MASSIEQTYHGQVTNRLDGMLAAQDGEFYLDQNKQQLASNLPTWTLKRYEAFSSSFLYDATTTWAAAETDTFYVFSEYAKKLGTQLQSNATTQLLENMTPENTSGLNILGSIYANNGMVSLLENDPTNTFQGVA